MEYPEYRYLWPPRPASNRAVSPDLLGAHERQGFVAQIKKCGTCSVLAVSPEGEIKAMNRHNQPHKLWSPTPASKAVLCDIPGWTVFVAELLHSKVSGGPRDTNYIFDVLVHRGEFLFGYTFAERQEILAGLFPDAIGEEVSHRVITPNLWVARNHTEGFSELFNSLTDAQDEGLVLKKPSGVLEMCDRDNRNQGWQLKVRRPHKNYSF